ncbi:MAG: hypothetical protein ACKV2O_22045 [Acidimicrobiales bacterium]
MTDMDYSPTFAGGIGSDPSAAGPTAIPSFPIPIPPDWWRCFRLGPVSGRYEGDAGTQRLVLRVDIDPRSTDSPVMSRVSGDFYRVFTIRLPGRPPITWSTYLESWIVDHPEVTWSRCSVAITGAIRYWKGTHPATDIQITIPWGTFKAAGPAAVELRPSGAAVTSFACARVSDCFRDLELEVDVCQSVNAVPVLPTYNTHGHDNRPATLRQRDLTIETAYREAGVCVTLRPERTMVDDSGPQHTSWSVAELHDAMETHYQRYGQSWPNWRMWGLLAGQYDSPSVGGIMFDARAAYGGAGRAPERQGFAVFRSHQWFNQLVEHPTTQAQFDAVRQLLYTWVHEAGHAFNLLHSWDKARPDSLSWMNYAWKYDNQNGAGSFWANSMLQFDDEELVHIRHGDRASVVMGGDQWGSGGHLESPYSFIQEPGAPLELLVRGRGYYEALEPVTVELRLRNLLDLEFAVDARLAPEYGNVLIEIRKPNGLVVPFSPISCQIAAPELRVLRPAGVDDGSDRYSELVLVAYGSDGHLFSDPGDYLIRAVYTASDQVIAVSNTERLRVGSPHNEETDRLALELHHDQAGLALALEGSRSRHLETGMSTLLRVVDVGGFAGAVVAATVGPAMLRPFLELSSTEDGSLTRVEHAGAEPDRVLQLTARGVDQLRRNGDKSTNLLYHGLVAARTQAHAAQGEATKARDEIRQLHQDLESREVKPSVLARVEQLIEQL